MKILILKREALSIADGISQFIFSVASGLLRLGHEVVCVSTHDVQIETRVRERFAMEQYPQLAALCEAEHLSNFDKFRAWRKHGRALVARHRPDLILINGAVPLRLPGRSVLVAHDVEDRKLGPLGAWGRILFKSITYRMADQIVTTCPELVAPVARECRQRPERITVIPTCIDTTRYAFKPLAERQPVILHMGQQPYKMAPMSLAAFAQMQSSQARLVVVGKPAADFLAALEKVPAAVRERVEVPGMVSVEKLLQLLAQSRVVSVPSFYVHPVASPTALEALASHTPAVLSRSISSIVAHPGETCFVENDAAAMARRFDQLVSDDALWERLSRQCAAAKQRFDGLTVAREYLALVK